MNNNFLYLIIYRNSITFAPHCYTTLFPYGLIRLTVLSTSSIKDTHCIEFSHIKGFKKIFKLSLKTLLSYKESFHKENLEARYKDYKVRR